MFARGFLVEEESGGLDHDVGANFVPFQFCWVAQLREAYLLAVDDKVITIDGNITLELAVHRIVLECVGQVIRLQQIIDTHHFDVGKILHRRAKHHAADAAETVNANLDRHPHSPISPK